MELGELVGTHELTGVDMEQITVRTCDSDNSAANCINFTLDNVTYSAIENPDDGYRSMMEEIIVTDKKLSNTFAKVTVMASMDNTSGDVLELHDTKNGKVILRVGTDNSNDYYPEFVSDWMPENLSINEGVK